MEAVAKTAGESEKHLTGSISHDLKISAAEGEATLETITPEIAAAWLEHNTMNRPLNRRQVDMIKDDLLRGAWMLTGETICFAKPDGGRSEGSLLDGQNRLTAIAESGVTVRSYVIRGLDKKVFSKTGNSKPRSGGDTLAIAHFKYPTRASAIVKFVMLMGEGKHGDAIKGYKKSAKNSDVLAFALKNRQKIEEICADKALYENPHIMTAGIAGGFHFIFDCINQRQANVFMHRLIDGTSLRKGSPIKVLRDKLENDAASKLKMVKYDKLALVIKTWNAFRRDEKTLKQLTFNRKKEDFPIPV